MSQVEGGDLLVLSRGAQEGRKRSGSYSAAGWQDGPWWRASDGVRDLGSVKGLVEGTKLCRVSAEAFAKEYFHSHGGVEEAARRATEELSQSVPVRSSDIFLAIQAISYSERSDLFGGTSTSSDDTAEKKDEAGDELIAFAIYLHDPVHSITYSTLSQPFPSKWVSWLDVPASQTREPSSTGKDGSYAPYYPADIAQIIEEGGVDPREWAAGHIEQAIGLAIGIVAQRYVAKRMGVGEGQTHHVRRANEGVMADGGGEAARAGI